MSLGQRISAYRKELGLSQEALGEKLGVSRQAVSKWETDVASPDMENLLALARVFGVSVAELTGTEEPPPPPPKPARRTWLIVLLVLAGLTAALLLTMLLSYSAYSSGGSSQVISPPEQSVEETIPSPAPQTDFALLWYGSDGDEEFLELGEQAVLFPFGTTLELTEPAEVWNTDFGSMTGHRADCGSVIVAYHHIKEETDRDVIWCLSTMVSGVRTPRGVHPGSTKQQVLDAYGDRLVYCFKETGGYSLVEHDYYYTFQTPETGGASLQLFMKDGLVAAIRAEHMAELGSEAFSPDGISRFPLKDGEPDFSQRQEPEQETLSDARRVYIARERLRTDNNLSAEEEYQCRREILALAPTMDWAEFALCAGEGQGETAVRELTAWLEAQNAVSGSQAP